jgi:hypothetical protein
LDRVHAGEDLHHYHNQVAAYAEVQAGKKGSNRYGRLLMKIAGMLPRPARRERMKVIEHNPEKAAEWFRQQGIQIEEDSG